MYFVQHFVGKGKYVYDYKIHSSIVHEELVWFAAKCEIFRQVGLLLFYQTDPS